MGPVPVGIAGHVAVLAVDMLDVGVDMLDVAVGSSSQSF